MALADPEVVVQKLIQQSLPEVTVGTLIPMEMPDPFVLVRQVPGPEADPRGLMGNAVVDIQGWVGGVNAKTAARDLLVSICNIIHIAWRQQTVLPGIGYIGGRPRYTDPSLLMDGTEVHGTFRYQTRLTFITRPV